MLTRTDDIPVRFLKLILPEQGCFVAAIKNPKAKGFKPSIFVETIEELWSVIQEADRDGYEAYQACACFKEPMNDPAGTPASDKRFGRTKDNALGARTFWLDIDVGKEKAFKNQDEAISALKDFCTKLGLPAPIIVSSGWGLHVYWPLQQMLDRETWEHYARGLKNLCRKHGLHVDQSRTADISSVLRTPGTQNHKHGTERKVEVDPEFLDIEPYAIEQFKVFADHTDAPSLRHEDSEQSKFDPNGIFELDKLKDLSFLATPNRRRLGLVGLENDYPPCSGELIAEQCEQVRALRDCKGNLPEPRWYAALGVLAFCVDGDKLGHDWSSGDTNRYTPRKTQERLDRARTLTGATTCQHFHDLDHAVCERCPHWRTIKSPITLGMQRATPQTIPTKTPATPQNPPRWERTRGNSLKPKSYINAATALKQLGIKFRHDIFHNKKIVEGDVVENLGRELSDPTCRALRDLIIAQYNVDCGIENVQQAAERACEENRFDPVLDYLDSLQWDGQPRLDRWMTIYLGAEDTPLNRSIGRKMLTAAVRRARKPGCKFDYVPILEGPQRIGKSTTIRILAGDDNFSDQPILHKDERTQQEAMEGIWIYELSELAGMRRTDVETLKNFVSRQEDKSRPAYGRFRVDQPRRNIFVGTTNDAQYMRDATGNSRFWPVRTSTIDLEALPRDRDQLWAEAAAAEAQGELLVIPAHLYGDVAEQQEQRRLQDPWDDLLAEVTGTIYNDDGVHAQERISSDDLLRGQHLQLPAHMLTDVATKRLRQVMNRLGWKGPKKLRFDKSVWDQRHQKSKKVSVTKQGYWRRPPGNCSG
jgi:predicted P-loop ATPase